jgi:tetratricopeptide (TPR) repeat protein
MGHVRPVLRGCLASIAFLLGAALPQVAPAHPGAHETAQHFSQQIQQDPQQQALYIHRGIAYSNAGDYSLALLDFSTAEQLGDPRIAGFDLGVLYYRMGELDRARHYFDTFLQHFPDDIGCLEYRARLSRDAGDYKDAVADFKRIFELQDNSNPGHYVSAAQMLSENTTLGTDAALDILDQGMAQLGVIPQLQHFAIQLETTRGNYSAALVRLQSLQTGLGDSPQWQVDMADLLAKLGQSGESREWYLVASQQLQQLRKTPARLALQQQIDTALPTLQ